MQKKMSIIVISIFIFLISIKSVLAESITTSVMGGTITESITEIISGEERTIYYSPSDNTKYLSQLIIDGEAVSIEGNENSYTFTNITEDIVKANSDKVKSGEINLGNALEGGSAQLTVNNVELSSDKIKGFENAAGEYTISNYLDIDLYNVFYKGKNDSDDVWSNKIDELEKEATISLKLADGITADDIVIVHNVHDGDKYEIIEIDSYDKETNTITFKTKSFSNYAIATRANVTSNQTKIDSNPKTFDSIIIWVSLITISALGLTVGFIYYKKRK